MLRNYRNGALLLLLAVGGCSANSTPAFLKAEKRPTDNIEIVEGQPKRKYKPVKELSVSLKKGNPQYAYVGKLDVADEMKRQALALGANAVINVKYQDQFWSWTDWGTVSGTGLAVKYVD
jgi:hypothetical protein